MTTIELLTFRPSAGVDHDAVVALDASYQQHVAYQVPGLLRRTTAVDDSGGWLVVTVWADRAAAIAAPELAESGIGRELLALVDDLSVRRYDTVA